MCMITDGHWWEQILEKVYCRHFKFMNLHSGPCWWVPPVSHEFSSQQTFLFQTLSDICWAKFCGRSILLLSHPSLLTLFSVLRRNCTLSLNQTDTWLLQTFCDLIQPTIIISTHRNEASAHVCISHTECSFINGLQTHKGAISSVITINPNHNYTLSGYPVL